MKTINIKKSILFKYVVFGLLIVFLALGSFCFLSKNSQITGDTIVKQVLATVSPSSDKNIEHVTKKFSNSIFESWHDPINNIWRSEYKDSEGNTDNVTIVKDNQVTQIAPKEKIVSITTLSDELVKENKYLYNKSQFDFLKLGLNQEGWNRLEDQNFNDSIVYVIERELPQVFENKINDKVVKVPGILRLYIDSNTSLIVKEEKLDSTTKAVVESDSSSYEIISPDKNLFDTNIPEGYKVQYVSQPNEHGKDN